jgi:hypothetical protein
MRFGVEKTVGGVLRNEGDRKISCFDTPLDSGDTQKSLEWRDSGKPAEPEQVQGCSLLSVPTLFLSIHQAKVHLP